MATTLPISGPTPSTMDMPPAGGQQPSDQISATNAENPYFSIPNGVGEEDKKKLKAIVSAYKEGWSQDRLERFRVWMQNVLYWKGLQVLGWDASSNCWYDALSWWRNEGMSDDGEQTDVEKWVNNLTLMFANVFTGTMSRAVPHTVVKPSNAGNIKDIATTKAAKKAIEIIERQNQIRKKVRTEFEHFYLFGCYFKHERAVVDGEMFGYDFENIFADMEVQVPAGYLCPNCGTDAPATSSSMAGLPCPGCGAYLGPETFHPAATRMSMQVAGQKRVPRPGVKMTIHSPLEIDADPSAMCLKETPLFWNTEIDIGEARMMLPQLRQQVQEGAIDPTSAQSEYEKLRRLDVVAAMGGYAADNAMSRPTYSRNWLQPKHFYKLGDYDFGDRMAKMFPEGLMFSMIGDLVIDVRAANMLKEWSHAALYESQGIYCQAIANVVVSFNARFNRTMWILDDWASRAPLGLNVADGQRLDTEKLMGRPMPANTIVPLPMRINGEARPMEQVFAHFDLPINPALWDYPHMLLTFCELIAGIPRQMGGQGTQKDVETLGGQQLQLDRAATTLKPYWENVKQEHATAAQNAIECLQKLMKSGAVERIWTVVEDQGGAFRNDEVDWQLMQGNVEVSFDEDQDLPTSPEELRDAIKMMFDALAANNPAAAAWFDEPENQELAISTLLPGSKLPSEAQRLKTLMDIQTLVERDAVPVLNPDGTQGEQLPAMPDKREDFPIAKKVLQEYMTTNFEIRVENPLAWQRLTAYGDMLEDADMAEGMDKAKRQLQVSQAGQPPKQGPDPTMMAAAQQLQQAAQAMVLQLEKWAELDPAFTKGTITGQVNAAKEIIDTAKDTAEMLTGAKE